MNPEIFSEWLRRQGLKVVRTSSSYWVEFGPRVFQAFPYHWIIEPTEAELMDFLKSQKAVGGRYSTPITAPQGSLSYHACYEAPSYTFENLSKWARKNTRRGLHRCGVEPISFDRLSEEGWYLQQNTLNRQGRRLKINKKSWQRICLSAKDLPGFEAWGALVGNQLAASVITFMMGDCCYMLYQQSKNDYLADHVNNALSYCVTETILQRPAILSILYGLHSLDAPKSVDEFKFRMGYVAKPVRQRVFLHPIFQRIANPITHFVLKLGHRYNPGNPGLAKAEGFIRFFLQGRLPLARQDWPDVLLNNQREILSQSLGA